MKANTTTETTHEKITELKDDLVDRIGALAEGMGLNRAIGQIYALLYISPTPISLDDISTQCHMSKGNACLNLKELEAWSAVRKSKIRGDRKDYYSANPDITAIVLNKLKTGLGRRLSEAGEILQNAESRLGSIEAESGEANGAIQEYREKLERIKELHQKAQKVVESMDGIRDLLNLL